MHLLVVTTSFPSRRYPGSGVFVARMLTHLPEDYRITVITPADDHNSGATTNPHRIRVIPFRYAPRRLQVLAQRPGGLPEHLKRYPWRWFGVPFFIAGMFWAVLKEAKTADLIGAHWSLSGVVAGVCGRLFQKPVVTTLRGADVNRSNSSMPDRWTLRLCAALNDHLVTVSDAMADCLKRLAPEARSKISTIPNGVGDGFRVGRSHLSSSDTCICVGSLIERKRIDTVLRAVARLTDVLPSLKLEIAGDGPQKERLEAMAHDLGIADQVVFTGMLPPDVVAQRLAAGAVFVLASTGEGRPNVILEAMAAGVPVIASDIEGVREMIGDDERGLLFPVGDDERLAVRIRHLLENPGRVTQLTDNARAWLHDQGLTWDNTARRYAALYQQILDEHPKESATGHR